MFVLYSLANPAAESGNARFSIEAPRNKMRGISDC